MSDFGATSVEELLAEALDLRTEEEKVADDSAVGYSGEELDLAEFVEDLHKTAAELQKLAEEMPLPPEIMARRLAMLDNPASITRQEVHDQFVAQTSSALPQAALSERIPRSVEEIQKTASHNSVGFLRRAIGRG